MPLENKPLKPWRYGEPILLLVSFVTVSLVFAGFVNLVNDYEVAIALPMLAVAAIVLLMIFLSGISYVFSRTGLEDRTQALGLPQGSIQAVLTLSLVVLFAMLSIFIFTSMGTTPLRRFSGLTAVDRDKEITVLGESFAGFEPDRKASTETKTPMYVVMARESVSDLEPRNDIAKQLLILIGTLMTSAVSFYFGSRATAAGASAANERGIGLADGAITPDSRSGPTLNSPPGPSEANLDKS